MIRDEFEDKLADLVSEYIENGEDIEDGENYIEANYVDEKREVSIELMFEITKELS